jgi:phosphoribosylglycinamide formyltransferase-1
MYFLWRVREGMPHENDKGKIMNIAVFASGRGTNFQAIINAVKNGKLKVGLSLLVCDNAQAPAIARAKKAGIKIALVERKDFSSREDFENRIIEHLKENRIDLIVMAGFMRMLSPYLVRKFKGRIINIHPAILPAFKGSQAIKDAFDYGVKITGVTVHFVDEEMDHGPIILQKAVSIEEKDTLKSLEAKIHQVEHQIYPEAIKLIIKKRLNISGRRVRIANR